ncbi:hypothetical protein BTM_4533 [Burkholderia thailandensis 34]|nr:hypothetical protein BTL_5060 [Burkholderia thailandensis H0587]AJY31760.1 hypothetical protein BTM_4533 [Burkholderia thailandensis 34]
MRGAWIYIALSAAVAISVAFSPFLMRYERARAAANRPMPETRSLRAGDIPGLAPIAAFAIGYGAAAMPRAWRRTRHAAHGVRHAGACSARSTIARCVTTICSRSQRRPGCASCCRCQMRLTWIGAMSIGSGAICSA